MTSSTSSAITNMNLDADTQQNILQLRGTWEFQNVAQFFHTFYAAFGLETFDTDILVFHDLCHWQLRNADKFRSHLSSQDNPADWRVSPVGYDAKGNTYWLFDDNRLCKEQHIAPPPSSKKSKAKAKARKGSRRNGKAEDTNEDNVNVAINNSETMIWETLCVTIEDWENFPQRFAKSRNAAEKEFYALLTEDIVPKVLEDLRTKEKERKKVEAVANRKRSQRIIEKEIAKKETERLVKVEEESNPMLQKGAKYSIGARSNGARLTRQSHKRSHTEIEDEVDREQRYKVQRAARESRMLRRNGGDISQEPSENENNVTGVSNGVQTNIPADTLPINGSTTGLFSTTNNHQSASNHTTNTHNTTSHVITSHDTSHSTTSNANANANRVNANRVNANRVNANRVNANRVNANRVNANRVNANRANANRTNANNQVNGQSDNQQEDDEQLEQMDDWFFECNCGLTGINIVIIN
ncbi:16343_t:CDS:2 [Entrophospora sp. SA101]|nr:16343_t:CDS:2 [Entrophospora sp. SA101]CAJ0914593.1 2205_t:CDS:2 [Entrophospora sp. SA101]